jgi:hypothetical protein
MSPIDWSTAAGFFVTGVVVGIAGLMWIAHILDKRAGREEGGRYDESYGSQARVDKSNEQGRGQ